MKTSLLKGTLHLVIAQLVFIVSGYIIHFWLGRYLGPALYGAYGVIIALLTTINLIQTTGLPQAVSKYIAEDERLADTIKKKALRIQLLSSLAAALIYFLLAGLIARFLNDLTLIPYIRLSALVIPVYAVYAIYVGYFNGLHYFRRQSLLIIIYSSVKLISIILLVLLLKLYGAILGFVIAPLVASLAGMAHSKRSQYGKLFKFDSRKLIKFAFPIIGFSIFITLVMIVDLFFVKALLKDADLTGYYTAATTISKIPYFLLSAFAAVLFPAISTSVKNDAVENTRELIRESIRFLLIFLVPGVLLISATSKNLVTLLYSSKYLPASQPLSILIFGLGFLTIFFVLSNILNGAGKPGLSVTTTFIVLLVACLLNLILVPRYQLNGAAVATTTAAFLAVLAGSILVYIHFQSLVSVRSVVKILFSAAIVYLLAIRLDVSKYFLPLEYFLLFGLYFLILFVFKEFGRKDIQRIRELSPIKIGFLDKWV